MHIPLGGQFCRTTDGNGNSVEYRYNSFGKAGTFRYAEEGKRVQLTEII